MIALVLFWIGVAFLTLNTLSMLVSFLQPIERFKTDLARVVGSLGVTVLFFVGALTAKYIGI